MNSATVVVHKDMALRSAEECLLCRRAQRQNPVRRQCLLFREFLHSVRVKRFTQHEKWIRLGCTESTYCQRRDLGVPRRSPISLFLDSHLANEVLDQAGQMAGNPPKATRRSRRASASAFGRRSRRARSRRCSGVIVLKRCRTRGLPTMTCGTAIKTSYVS